MSEPHANPFYERFLAPYPLFLGIALSFAVCCVAGALSARTNCYRDFERFHTIINVSSHYYPTAWQVRSLGKARLDPDKIIVVVGGSSILHGSGQPPVDHWTKKLQAQLGDQFQVINLAMPGAHVMAFGGAAAEILAPDFPRLIFLADLGPACTCPDPDGNRFYQYFFWDAYHKGLLRDDPLRDERLTEVADERSNSDAFAELQTQMRLDACFYFRDLWTTISYKQISTTWNAHVSGSFMKARMRYGDPDTNFALPMENRYSTHTNDISMETVRGWIHLSRTHSLAPIPQLLWRNGQGTESRFATLLERTVKAGLPESLRRRTLLCLIRESPHYIDQLASYEKSEYDALFPATAKVVEESGAATVEIGRDYPASAYYDRCHFSVEGGTRLADDVAPHIRRLAVRLGYRTQEQLP